MNGVGFVPVLCHSLLRSVQVLAGQPGAEILGAHKPAQIFSTVQAIADELC
jgi:hypothetical protein